MTTAISWPDRCRFAFWTPIFLCLTINSAILAGIAINNPVYFLDYRLNTSPDAVHYVLLGRNALLHGHFSRCESVPYVPDMLRTPVYPLFSGALDAVGKPMAIYLAQVLLQLASCAVAYKFAERHFGALTGFFASLFVGTDLMWAISNFEALSEPLFLFLMICSADRLSRSFFSEPSVSARGLEICAAGLLLGLAILTRPVALYLVVLYVGIAFFAGPRWRRPATRLSEAAILMVATLILPEGWVVRNYSLFSIPRLTHVDLGNLVYFVGSGAFQVERGLDLETARQVISEEFDLPSYTVVQNYHMTNYPLKSIVAKLRHAWPRVVFKYPRSLCLSSGLAVIKSIGSHNVATVADMNGRSWIAPKTGNLIRFRAEAFERLAKNGPLLTIAFFWELTHTLLSIGLGLFGIALSLQSPGHRAVGILWLVSLCYFGLTIPLFGVEAYFRCRFPILPYLYLFGGVGASGLVAISPKHRRAPKRQEILA
jgi:4-amino-4-deoxy-L-arabinose transferase-like glycosyltransferase